MSRLDLTSSFWQIPLDEHSQKYTAFLYKNKSYQFRIVPFFLVTSLAAIVRCLELALGPEVEEYCSIFVDDKLVMSRSYEEHVQHLADVFRRLEQANLVLNKSKCEFFKTEIKFLGHIITSEVISTDPEKIKSFIDFPTPRKAKDIRAFMGLTGYYRRFAKDYSKVVAPLLDLLKKTQKWKWEAEQEDAFNQVKHMLQENLHLFHPEREGTYVVHTDASDVAVGSVLYQRTSDGEYKVIAYANRTLKGAERNYFTAEKEILAVVYTLSKFRYYLYGRPFEVFTDNQSVSFMFKCRLGNARLTRWIMAIQ